MGKIVSRMVPNASDKKLHQKHYWYHGIVKIYNYKCGWCGSFTNNDFVAYTTIGAIDHMCWNCWEAFQITNKLPNKRQVENYS